MDTFTEITQAQANKIGEFEYEPGEIFSPFVGKQTNGNFIVSKEMFDLLKNSDQFKKISWSGKNFVPAEELDFEKSKLI